MMELKIYLHHHVERCFNDEILEMSLWKMEEQQEMNLSKVRCQMSGCAIALLQL